MGLALGNINLSGPAVNSGGSNINVKEVKSLADLQAASQNEILSIQSLIDLGGGLVTLPLGCYIKNDGGSIINGSIDLSGGFVDPTLIYYSVTYSNGKASTLTFEMTVENAGVDETQLANEATPTAGELIMGQTNKERIQHMIFQADTLGINHFIFPDMDAWLDMSALYLGFGYMGTLDERETRGLDIFLKSDTWYELQPYNQYDSTKGTTLRVIANNDPGAKIFSAFQERNIKITGGILIGDRQHHDYSPVVDEGGASRDTHDFGTLLGIHGVHNMLVEGMYMTQHTGDCIILDGSSIRGIDGQMGATRMEALNITIRGNTLLYARRNNISFIDGRMVTIENNTIAYAGNGYTFEAGVGNWGTLPMNGIDIEPYQEGIVGSLETALYEDAKNVRIVNNDFYGNYKLDINCFKGNRFLIDNNTFTNQVNIQFSFEVTISNNTSIMDDTLDIDLGTKVGISINNFLKINAGGTFQLVYGNVIENNTIIDFDAGISTAGGETTISNNKIYDFLVFGISAGGRNTICSNNHIQSDVVDAHGVEVQNTSNHPSTYEGNKIVVPNGSGFYLDGVHEGLATSTIRVAAGSSGSIDSVLADGVEITSAPVPYNTSLIQTATDLAANINAHTSVPNYTATTSGNEVFVKPADGGIAASEFSMVVSATTLTMYYTDFTEAPQLKKITIRNNFIDSPEIIYVRNLYGLNVIGNEITGVITYEDLVNFKIQGNYTKNTITTPFISGFYNIIDGEISDNDIKSSATNIISLNGVDNRGAERVEILRNKFNQTGGSQTIYIHRGVTENIDNVIANNRFEKSGGQTSIRLEATNTTIQDNYSIGSSISHNITGTNPIKYTKPNPICPTYADNATALAALGEGYYYKITGTNVFDITHL